MNETLPKSANCKLHFYGDAEGVEEKSLFWLMQKVEIYCVQINQGGLGGALMFYYKSVHYFESKIMDISRWLLDNIFLYRPCFHMCGRCENELCCGI